MSIMINTPSPFPEGFDYLRNIDPSILQVSRYATSSNFVGQVIEGYKSTQIVISNKAGQALANVQRQLNHLGYSLVVYDAYRPQKAVDHFVRWANLPQDHKTKSQFYPFITKSQIIPEGYLAMKSAHSRGSAVDLTIIRLDKKVHQIQLSKSMLKNGQVIDYHDDGSEYMGSHFDFFGQSSHHDTNLVSQKCLQLRKLLREIMQANGFRPLRTQWWHYTLIDQPFPQTFFDFDII